MNVFSRWYPASILILWFGIFAAFFVVLPEFLIWGYIVGLPVLIIYNIYQHIHVGNLQIRVGLIDVAIVLYIGYTLISIFANDSLPLSVAIYINEVLFRIVVPVSVYWFIRLNPISADQLKLWTYFLAALIVVETFLGFITLFAPLILPEAYQPRPIHLYKRATGSFVTPSTYVLTLFVGIVFIFYRIRNLAPSRERATLIALLIIGMLGIIISQNRAGWLVLPFLIAMMIYLEPTLRRWLIGTFVFLVFVTIVLRPDFFSQSLNRLRESRQVESRITMGVAGVELFLANPIWGWGYGTYDLNDWRFMRTIGEIEPTRYEISQATSHNTYLTIFCEMGIFGFILYIFPTAYLILKSFTVYQHHQTHYNWRLIFMMWLVVGIINTAAQFADFRFFPFVLGYWWMALAIIANELMPYTQRLPSNPITNE
jgi:O-antigen ligase